MGRLKQLLQQKVEDNIREKRGLPRRDQEIERHKEEEQHEIKVYNQTWLLKTTGETGWIINSDRKKAQDILDALNRRNGQCPCGGNGKQFKCPCIVMREHGICKCGLFENVKSVEPKGRSTARIKVNEE